MRAIEYLVPEKGDFRSSENTVPLDDIAIAGLNFCMGVEDKPDIYSEIELPDLSRIVDKRIECMKLPIIFTKPALLAVCMFTTLPGEAIVLLCDALTYFERKTVRTKELMALYPYGFYKKEIFQKIVQGEILTNKHRWSNVYNV